MTKTYSGLCEDIRVLSSSLCTVRPFDSKWTCTRSGRNPRRSSVCRRMAPDESPSASLSGTISVALCASALLPVSQRADLLRRDRHLPLSDDRSGSRYLSSWSRPLDAAIFLLDGQCGVIFRYFWSLTFCWWLRCCRCCLALHGAIASQPLGEVDMLRGIDGVLYRLCLASKTCFRFPSRTDCASILEYAALP